jgi:hypothetical protein
LRFQKVICFCPLRIVIENLSLSLHNNLIILYYYSTQYSTQC